MPPKIILVRHGESEANVPLHTKQPLEDNNELKNGDSKLTALGLKQACVTGKFLQQALEGVDDKDVYVYSSPLLRAINTALQFRLQTHTLHTLPCLIECTNANKTIPNESYKWDVDKQESYKRVKHFIDDDFQSILEYKYKFVVIFGHSVFFSILLSVLSNSTFYRGDDDDDALTFHLPNCSITTIEMVNGKWRFYHVGSIAHLPKELVTGEHCNFASRQN
jgi:broad specificity phosphatase PhoE